MSEDPAMTGKTPGSPDALPNPNEGGSYVTGKDGRRRRTEFTAPPPPRPAPAPEPAPAAAPAS